MPYITKEAEVWVDLDDFDDDDLMDEIRRRGMNTNGPYGSTEQIIYAMYEHQAMGKDIEPLLRELYYTAIGKIV